MPSRSTVEMPATLPISTPLNVTLEPGSTTSPARGETTVSCVRDANVPRNCSEISTPKAATMTRSTTPATLYGG